MKVLLLLFATVCAVLANPVAVPETPELDSVKLRQELRTQLIRRLVGDERLNEIMSGVMADIIPDLPAEIHLNSADFDISIPDIVSGQLSAWNAIIYGLDSLVDDIIIGIGLQPRITANVTIGCVGIKGRYRLGLDISELPLPLPRNVEGNGAFDLNITGLFVKSTFNVRLIPLSLVKESFTLDLGFSAVGLSGTENLKADGVPLDREILETWEQLLKVAFDLLIWGNADVRKQITDAIAEIIDQVLRGIVNP